MMFEIHKSILEAAALAHTSAFNAEIQEATTGPPTTPSFSVKPHSAAEVIQLFANAMPEADPKPEPKVVPWPIMQPEAIEAIKPSPDYSNYVTKMIEDVANAFRIPTMEALRAAQYRQDIKRQLRRAEARNSYEFSMANLPEWVEEPHQTSQEIAVAWLDFYDGLGLFDSFIDRNRLIDGGT